MTVLQSILLGALQGLTEFLPVSSSGHLAVVQHFFNLEEIPLLFDVFLHLATLLAVFIYFRKQIVEFLQILYRWVFRKPAPENALNVNGLCRTEEAGRKTIIAIIITTAITGVLGLVSSKLIPDLPLQFVFAGFIVTACLLIVSGIINGVREKNNSASEKEYTGITPLQAVIIGLFQGAGTLPGISRSGSTISGALLSGVSRELAGEYSFIVSIPAIFAAFLLELKDLGDVTSSVGILPLVAGCVSAFAVGYVALALLMKIIKKGKLEWFAAYLISIGIAGLVMFAK